MKRGRGPIRLTRLDEDGQPTGPSTLIDGEFCLDCDEPDPEDCATFAGSTLKRLEFTIELCMTPRHRGCLAATLNPLSDPAAARRMLDEFGARIAAERRRHGIPDPPPPTKTARIEAALTAVHHRFCADCRDGHPDWCQVFEKTDDELRAEADVYDRFGYTEFAAMLRAYTEIDPS